MARSVTSPEGRFRISAPADFVKEVKDVPYGEQRVSESSFRALLPKLGFLASYLDLPAEMAKAEPGEILNAELDGHVHLAGIELLHRELTPFAGFPAVHFKLHDVSKGIFVEGILLLVKERRYQLAFQYTSESSAPNGEQFFNSFEVLEGP